MIRLYRPYDRFETPVFLPFTANTTVCGRHKHDSCPLKITLVVSEGISLGESGVIIEKGIASPKGPQPEAEVGFLGPHQLGGLRNDASSPSGVRDGAPGASGHPTVFGRPFVSDRCLPVGPACL